MAAFRTKILGLAGAAMLFSGIASAQFTCTTVLPTLGSGLIRAEGQTELIQQLTISGCATAPAGGVSPANTNGTVQIFLSSAAGPVTVTSPSVALPVTATPFGLGVTPLTGQLSVPANATEAQLTLTGAGVTNVTYYGTASGGTVTFNNINFVGAAPTSMIISNVRVNASQVSVNGSPVPIQAIAYVSVTGPTIVATATTQTTAALVLQGLQASKTFKDAAQSSGGTIIGSPFGVCGSINNGGGGSATANFFLSIDENFANAFKSRSGSGVGLGTAYASGSESSNIGSDLPLTQSGTRFQVTFGNIPTGMNIFLPLTVSAPDGAVLTAITSPTANTSSVPVTASSPNSVSGLGLFQITPTAGSATGYYEVTVDNSGLDSFSIPIFLQAGTNAIVNQATSLTSTVSFAPQSALVTGPASSIPLFTTTSTPTTLIGFTLCQTSLLFPFVTNQAGFETGLAISNTSKDPTGQAKPQTGACTMNYYGTGGTNPTAGPAPNFNEGPVGGPFAAGEAYAFTLTSALAQTAGNPATFQGYIIAVCQFQNAHGFAYITYQFPGPSSSTMGYLALVLSRGNLSTGAEILDQ